MSSNIEWTDATWNPVVGCTPVSPGCLNCYAATMARRLEGMGKKEYQPREVPLTGAELRAAHAAVGGGKLHDHERVKEIRIAEVRGGRAVFTGEVRTVPDRLEAPLRWRKPRRVFVNSMSDLFHEAVPFEFVDRVWEVMYKCPQHTFQILTKRPERMAAYFEDVLRSARKQYGDDVHEQPLPNVWLGTSVEDQARADERIPHLLKCPAAVRFLSCEPLLGPVDLTAAMPVPLFHCSECGNEKRSPDCGPCGTTDNPVSNALRGVDWIIVGGESGHDARWCDVGSIRNVIAQCKAAGVPCFVKQLGTFPSVEEPDNRLDEELLEGLDGDDRDVWTPSAGTLPSWVPADLHCLIRMKNRKGGDPAEWPEDLRVREWPANTQKAVA